MIRAVTAVVAVALLTQAYVDLSVSHDIGGWHADAPIADLAGLGLILLLPLTWRARAQPPAPIAALAFAIIGVASALLAPPSANQSLGDALHWLVRKPVFLYVAYGVALPAAIGTISADTTARWLRASLGIAAGIAIFASIARIVAGNAGWWAPVAGLTPNQKALAVWMSPFVAWLWPQRGAVARGLLAAVVVAIGLSLSKTAWITAGFACAWVVQVGGRPIVARWWLVAPAVALALLFATLAPFYLGSRSMRDAERARESLDLRAEMMFAERPLTGIGPGSSTTYELHEFPHYRINGVGAHGVIEQVAGEEGALGLLAWLAFTGGLGVALVRAWDRDTRGVAWGWLGVAAALHVNLLTSTEAFSMTHWIPLGLVIGNVLGRPSCAS